MKRKNEILPATLMQRVAVAAVCIFIGLGSALAQRGERENAKRLQWGVKGGVNFSQLTFEKSDGKSVESKSIVGGVAGLTATYAFSPNWRLHSGLEMSLKGFAADVSGSSNTLKARAAYLQIPLEGGYAFDFGGWNLEPRIGLYFAYGLAGKYTISGTMLNEDTFGNELLKRFDSGLRLGFYTDNGKIVFGIGGDIGLTEVNGKKFSVSGGSVSLQNLSLCMGYLF
ncbi:MAG: porin family protein [Porphyromonas sp.]|nr:porin family protein [Porphyromonas sp.]